ncbi:MAG: roadblock/LC7 domain-containing protein [Gemmatimonadaceae bacterium]
MPTLRELTDAIRSRPGVQEAVILGDDGLVIETHGSMQSQAESLAARVPAFAVAARQLGQAADAGDTQLALLEFERGYGVVLSLSSQAMLFVAASREVNLSDLLFDLRRHRSAMAALV